MSRSILKLKSADALEYFLKSKSYFSLNLPIYYNFDILLKNIYNQIKNKDFNVIINSNCKPSSLEDVNYKIICAKDGKYIWRELQLIHPVFYVDLVKKICEEENWKKIKKRFNDFSKNKNIVCCSLPMITNKNNSSTKSTILNWWNNFEQQSMACCLEYNYMGCTDISNCYPSIYTHSIAWAIETKDIAKKNHDIKLIGNYIDKHIQWMSYNQTNGIPQGSVLTDFIAEIVLGYGDELLTSRIEQSGIKNYKILRYRDDYKIFTKSKYDLEIILKLLSQTLHELNFNMNGKKTFTTEDAISNILKKDKEYRFEHPISPDLILQKKLFLINQFSKKYPNSGSVKVYLSDILYNEILELNQKPNSLTQIISIVVDIMINNSNSICLCVAILSKLLTFFKKEKCEDIILKILEKYENIPNNEYLHIWLQRLTIINNKKYPYDSKFCKKLYDKSVIWNSSWCNIKFDEIKIINENELNLISNDMSKNEVDQLTIKDYE